MVAETALLAERKPQPCLQENSFGEWKAIYWASDVLTGFANVEP